MSHTRAVWLFLLGLTAIRFTMLGTSDLSFDEAHYWMWSDRLAPAYFSKGPGIAFAIRASNDPLFSTFAGLVRDGSASSDVTGGARGVSRLDPPIFDTFVNGSGVLRYRALTRDSGFWYNGTFNSGQRGYGKGIYVENFNDLQKETTAPGV